MGIRSTARTLLVSARAHFKSRFQPPADPHRPDLSDAALIACLPPVSDRLRAAQQALTDGDQASARRAVVDHFLERRDPRFFCDPDQVSPLAASIRSDRTAWIDALTRKVDGDLKLGLRVMSRRDKPLTQGFEWANIALGPGNDNLFSAQPHRYGFMPQLVLAEYHGLPTLRVVESVIERWIVVTVEGEKESYHSPLAVLYRVLALSWTFTFVAGLRTASDERKVDLLFKILKILRVDTEYLNHTIGNSYPNNHLLADGFAGWYLGTLYPEFPGAAVSKATGEAIFLRELCRQFYDDGTCFEHSTHYHELGCEMAVAYVLLSRRNGIEPAANVVEKVKRMLAFQSALSGPEAVPLPIGDSTEDPLFPLDAGHGWAAGAMRELYRALFDANIEAAPPADATVERAYWLLGGALAASSSAPSAKLPSAFEQGGFYIQTDAIRRARLVFRSGPVEDMQISAGHAHADLLNVYLSVGGTPLVVNSGTYTYRYGPNGWPAQSPRWRAYLPGPQSHNGLILSADPYGEMVGDFRNRDIPCRVRRNRCVETTGVAWLEFEVTRENAQTGHQRGVVHIGGHYWIIYDRLPDTLMEKDVSIGLQFAARASAVVSDSRTMVDAAIDGVHCSIALSAALREPQVLVGSMTPLAGWISPRYGELVPAPQLRVRVARGSRLCAFALQAACHEVSRCSIEAELTNDSCTAFRMVGPGFVDMLLIRNVDTGTSITAWDVAFEGTLVWMRTVDGELSEFRTTGDGELRYRGQRIG